MSIKGWLRTTAIQATVAGLLLLSSSVRIGESVALTTSDAEKGVTARPANNKAAQPKGTAQAASSDDGVTYWVYDKNDPIDHMTYSRPYEYLTYPKTPSQVYGEHVDLAEAGVASSMFWVSTALRECRRVPRNEQGNEGLKPGSGKRPKHMLETLIERCKGLAGLIPSNTTYVAQANSWLEKAAQNGHRTSQLILAIDRGGFSESSKVFYNTLETLAEAVQTNGYPAYYEAARYITLRTALENQRRRDAGQAELPASSLPKIAWDWAACDLHPGCDLEKFEYALTSFLYPHQVEEVREMVVLIAQGELPGLEELLRR